MPVMLILLLACVFLVISLFLSSPHKIGVKNVLLSLVAGLGLALVSYFVQSAPYYSGEAVVVDYGWPHPLFRQFSSRHEGETPVITDGRWHPYAAQGSYYGHAWYTAKIADQKLVTRQTWAGPFGIYFISNIFFYFAVYWLGWSAYTKCTKKK
jgi:hypothetical protein